MLSEAKCRPYLVKELDAALPPSEGTLASLNLFSFGPKNVQAEHNLLNSFAVAWSRFFNISNVRTDVLPAPLNFTGKDFRPQ